MGLKVRIKNKTIWVWVLLATLCSFSFKSILISWEQKINVALFQAKVFIVCKAWVSIYLEIWKIWKSWDFQGLGHSKIDLKFRKEKQIYFPWNLQKVHETQKRPNIKWPNPPPLPSGFIKARTEAAFSALGPVFIPSQFSKNKILVSSKVRGKTPIDFSKARMSPTKSFTRCQ